MNKSKGLYRRFLKYAQPYWPMAVLASLCFVASGFLGAYPIQVFKRAVDIAVGDAEGDANSFIWLALGYLALRLGLGAVQLVEAWLSKRLVQNVVHDLRRDLYAHLQRLSLSFYENQGSGDIMSRALGDVGAVAGGFMGPLTRLTGELTQLAWALIFLFGIHPQLTLIALLVAPPIGYLVYRFGNKMHDMAWKIRQRNSALWSFLMQNIAGIREIKIFGREDIELARFEQHSRDLNKLGLEDSVMNATLAFLTGLLFSVGEMVVLLVGGLSMYRGEMTPGMLTAFLMYVRFLYNPVITISRRYDQTQRTLASAVRVFEVMDRKPKIQDRGNAITLEKPTGELAFHNVQFGYQRKQTVLHDINFTASVGSVTALVGHSGGGKSTISKLVPRFYDPRQGSVTLDGRDLREYSVASLRQHIAVVFQEGFLFNDTVRENIAFGKPHTSEDKVIAAAQAANAHEFITALPQGYNTHIGERGVKLSGGQRQRIAIARALLKDTRLLILDEATSSVDSETERLIQQALKRLMEGRTSLVIAHRLSTIMHADQILVIEDGQIAERGIHESLLKQNGAYTRLYHAQYDRANNVSHA